MGEITGLDLRHERKLFFSQGWRIALPVMIQNLISVSLNIIDSIMIGGLGEAPLAAVGSANQIYLIYSEICFGMFSGAGVFVAQYWGIKDLKTIRKVLGIDYIVAMASAIVMIILIQFTAPFLIDIFVDDPDVIGLGVDYIQIAKYSYFFMGLSFCISFNSRAIQKLVVPTVVSAVAIVINTIGNWILIYGHCGFEAMGVEGAAYATVFARIIEFLVLSTYLLASKKHPLRATPKELTAFDRTLVKDVFKMSLPVCGTEVGWAICMSLMYVAYGKISYEALAVVQVAEVVTCFFQCIYFGLGNAAAFIIGATLGRGEKERAYHNAKLTMRTTWCLNVVMTTLLLLLRPWIMGFYNFSQETMELLFISMGVWAFTITPKMLVYVLICGVLRSGGDTVFAFRVDFLFNVVEVGLAFFGVLVMEWSLPAVVAFVALGEVIKAVLGYIRMYSGKWINTITEAVYE